MKKRKWFVPIQQQIVNMDYSDYMLQGMGACGVISYGRSHLVDGDLLYDRVVLEGKFVARRAVLVLNSQPMVCDT